MFENKVKTDVGLTEDAAAAVISVCHVFIPVIFVGSYRDVTQACDVSMPPSSTC